ncbi:unnamed protein product [Periconia digitata]|uniref:Uncharacterized protein n=1 Tax=Periconia digitata TaxID=1303443 RepID=A0A9W4UTA0_9PLEO|nr:unnamed protein product [Periconia digitata]
MRMHSALPLAVEALCCKSHNSVTRHPPVLFCPRQVHPFAFHLYIQRFGASETWEYLGQTLARSAQQ